MFTFVATTELHLKKAGKPLFALCSPKFDLLRTGFVRGKTIPKPRVHDQWSATVEITRAKRLKGQEFAVSFVANWQGERKTSFEPEAAKGASPYLDNQQVRRFQDQRTASVKKQRARQADRLRDLR